MDNDICLFELEPSWKQALFEELKQPYIASLAAFVEKERLLKTPVYPPKELVFNAFWKTPFDKVKAVIIGQDPYHGKGQAHGLCFSVPDGIAMPPSLQNIYKEIKEDVGQEAGVEMPKSGCLNPWAEQGVLLLNTLLTVREAEPMSHAKKGWERFTDAVVEALAKRSDPIIFLLWGRSAKEKCEKVKALGPQHTLLTAPHPSPLSAYQGFFGCRHFSKTNEILSARGQAPIHWI